MSMDVVEDINTRQDIMKVAFLFPGQGSQSVGMGKDIYEEFEICSELFDDISQACDIDFKSIMFSENELLNKSEFTQPSIVLNSFMCFLALKNKIDIKPEFAIGHSLGEFAALSVSGGLNMKDTVHLVNLRGKFMSEDCAQKEVAMMVVLGLSDEIVENACKDYGVWAANYNCEGQIVVAGIKENLISLESKLKELGAKRTMMLNMSVVSHCPILQNSSEKLAKELEKYLANEFNPVISNVTAKPYTTKTEALELLKRQLISPVLYKQSIKSCESQVDCFIEFGATILKGLNRKITTKPTYSIFDLQSLEEVIKAIS